MQKIHIKTFNLIDVKNKIKKVSGHSKQNILPCSIEDLKLFKLLIKK